MRYRAKYGHCWSFVNAKIGESRRQHICLKYKEGGSEAEASRTQFSHNINKPELILRYPHAFIRMFELNTGVEKADSGALYIPKKTPILFEKDLTQAQLRQYAITNLPINALIFEVTARDEYIKTAPNDLIKNEIINKFPPHINQGINTILSYIDDIGNNNKSWDNIDSSIDQTLLQ